MKPLLITSFAAMVMTAVSGANAQSYRCAPEHVTFAGHKRDGVSVEKTTVNWKTIEYHISGKSAVLVFHKDSDKPETTLNPQTHEEALVLENTPEKIVMLSNKASELTLDVIYPQDGNGYSVYVSDYPKRMFGGNAEIVSLSKLYLLKCEDTFRARPQAR